jgi:crossover junction endodeoxyribonuclease RuvC
LTRCGIGVVEQVPGRKPVFVAAGVVRTPMNGAHEQRLLAIEQGITQAVEFYQPDAIAVERAFAQQNLHSVAGTIQAAGIAMLVAARLGIPVTLHTPTEVKAAVTGSGRADKAQIGAMVVRILGLTEAPKPADAADAVALALCHLWRGGATSKYALLEATMKRQQQQGKVAK